MPNIMWTTIKSIGNSFFVLIFLILSFPSKNSKDVSNCKKKTISHKKKYSLNLVNSKDGKDLGKNLTGKN